MLKVLQHLGFIAKTLSVNLKKWCCNMYRNTRFSDLLEGVSRSQFQEAVDQYQGDKHSKGFTCWDQLVSMIYGQLCGSRSLRELESSFNSHRPKHYHLHTRDIKRSTLSEANSKRSAEIYASYCEQLLRGTHRRVRKEVSDLLYLIDSTPIILLGRGYDWTTGRSQPHIRGMKLHVQYAAGQQVPVHAKMTMSNVNDIDMGREMEIDRGATYVFDKGYYDYSWWKKIDRVGARFVTRLKRNAALTLLEKRRIPEEAGESIITDEVMMFRDKYPRGLKKNGYDSPVRRILVERGPKKEHLVLVTNDLDSPALEIAGLYKRRWGIELWFKWLKQRLKIKTFIGRSENAIRIQVLIALITYLLADRLRRHSGQMRTEFYLWLAELKATLMDRPRLDYAVMKSRERREVETLSRQVTIPM